MSFQEIKFLEHNNNVHACTSMPHVLGKPIHFFCISFPVPESNEGLGRRRIARGRDTKGI